MPRMMILGRGGVLDVARILAIVPERSAPIQRLLKATPPTQLINMTYGYPKAAVIILDNGFVVIVSQTVAELVRALGIQERLGDAEDPVGW